MIQLDDELSKPELHALGAQKLSEQHGIDVSSVANIELDGIGEQAAVTAEYSIEISYERGKGVQYELERNSMNARDIDEQPTTEKDLEYLENQIEGVLNEYNQVEQHVKPAWNYGQDRIQALDD